MHPRGYAWLLLALLMLVAAGCSGDRAARGSAVTPIPSKTLRPTFTNTPLRPTTVPPTATPLAIPTAAAQPATPTLPPSATPVPPTAAPPTATATPQKATFTVTEPTVNVRAGPGVGYAILGEVRQGQTFEITGKNAAGDWWQFAYDGRTGWVTSGMVTAKGADKVQVAASIPTPPPQPTARPTVPPPPTNTPAPTTRFAMTGKVQLRVNTNDNVSVWCFVMNRAGTGLLSGTIRVIRNGAVVKEQSFIGEMARGDSGYSSEFLYNAGCKVELRPAENGNYTAYLISNGQQDSDPFNFVVSGETNRIAIIEWKEK